MTSGDTDFFHGRLILHTRPAESSAGLNQAIERRGGTPLALPVLQVVFPENYSAISKQLLKSEIGDWLFVTSPNGAHSLERLLKGLPKNFKNRFQIGAVGEGTAVCLEGLGLSVSFVPKQQDSGGFAAEFIAAMPDQKRHQLFLFRANTASDELPRALCDAGFDVKTIDAYSTLPIAPSASRAELIGRFLENPGGMIVTSSLSAKGILELAGERADQLRTLPVVAIGAKTRNTLAILGFSRVLQATTPTVPNMLDALCELM